MKQPAEKQLGQSLHQWAQQQAEATPLSAPASLRVPASRWYWPAAAAAVAVIAWFIQFSGPASNAPVTEPMLLTANYSLDALDKRIQRAYSEGANPSEVEVLWQQREQLVATQNQGVSL